VSHVQHNTNLATSGIRRFRTYIESIKCPHPFSPNHWVIHDGIRIAQYPHSHFQVDARAAFCLPAAMSGLDQCHISVPQMQRAMPCSRSMRTKNESITVTTNGLGSIIHSLHKAHKMNDDTIGWSRPFFRTHGLISGILNEMKLRFVYGNTQNERHDGV
jgi:hypothetical protein